MVISDLCGQQKKCSPKEIESRVYDICEDCWTPLAEKLTGKGYPCGLSGKEISLFGRISAIADCYDALTTRRPYKVAYKPFSALKMIAKDTGDYDGELLRTFVKMIGKIQ